MMAIFDSHARRRGQSRAVDVDARPIAGLAAILSIVVTALVGSRLSSTTPAGEGVAVALCIVAAATAATRLRFAGFAAVAASLAMSCLALSMLLATGIVESDERSAGAGFILLAAIGLWLSVAGRGDAPSRLLRGVLVLSLLMALLVATWPGDRGPDGASAIRLMTTIFLVVACLSPTRFSWSAMAAIALLAIAAVSGGVGVDLSIIETAGVSGVAVLTIWRWWNPVTAVAFPGTETRRHDVQLAWGRLAGAGLLGIASLLAAIAGEREAAMVLLAGLVVGASLIGAPALTRLVEREGYVRSLERTAREIARQAQVDGLTLLPNRQAFEERLAEETERALRYQQPLALCFIDIDHFKAINDTHGHEAGDGVLVSVALTLRSTARAIDIVCRYGGEEFVVIAPGTWTMDALVLAERLRDAVSAITVAGRPTTMTISLGVSGIPEHADDASTLLRRADAALYTAKRAGRNRTHVARSDALSDPG